MQLEILKIKGGKIISSKGEDISISDVRPNRIFKPTSPSSTKYVRIIGCDIIKGRITVEYIDSLSILIKEVYYLKYFFRLLITSSQIKIIQLSLLLKHIVKD